MIDYFLCLKIALIAFVYSEILTEPEKIFYKLYLFLQEKAPAWLFKPLIGCCVCVSGQIALWYCVSICILPEKKDFINLTLDNIFFVSLTIFICLVIVKVWQKVI